MSGAGDDGDAVLPPLPTCRRRIQTAAASLTCLTPPLPTTHPTNQPNRTTPGVDCQVKVWDVRTFKPLHAYFANSPATALDISQKGMLAVAQGRRLQVRARGFVPAWTGQICCLCN